MTFLPFSRCKLCIHPILYLINALSQAVRWLVGWLVGCFGFNGPFRQYFRLYRAVSQREGERGEKEYRRVKMAKQPQHAPTASAVGPCPTVSKV